MVLKKALPGNCSILLVSVWVVDELPMQLLCLQARQVHTVCVVYTYVQVRYPISHLRFWRFFWVAFDCSCVLGSGNTGPVGGRDRQKHLNWTLKIKNPQLHDTWLHYALFILAFRLKSQQIPDSTNIVYQKHAIPQHSQPSQNRTSDGIQRTEIWH